MTESCDLKTTKIDAKPRMVSVNGINIPRGDIARETQNHEAKTPIEAWKKAARALAIRELLRQESERLAIVAEPQVDADGRRETAGEAAMRALIDQEVKVPVADEETCRRYYMQNSSKFWSAALYAPRHILIPASPKDQDARLVAKAEAERVAELVAAHPERFPSLAEAYSACPSKQVGGTLGQVGPGQTVREFEAALTQMEPGNVPTVVETRYGFHIVLLDQKIEGRALPFELVHQRIADYLDETVRRRAMRQYVEILAGRAQITGIDLTPETQISTH
ncbi:MAG: peptidylprolyl isomerase [Proteobacteria bacterium]|nr:peptidylprolyl isomerase [Pseudomonadota bacterium]